jgi:shikimate dehydrogenase
MVWLFGHPVAHSVSPQIHNAGLAEAGVDAVYLAADVAPDNLRRAVEGLRALGAAGANVTVPHKQAVGEHLDGITDEAEAVGAVNTLYWDGGRLVGDNTDAAGLGDVLAGELGIGSGDGVAVHGAGGAARAVAVAAGRLAAALSVTARRPDRADEVAALGRSCGARPLGGQRPRVLVNATPLGLHGEALPTEWMHPETDQVALDLVYGVGDTPFLTAARQAGADGRDGLGMLVAQAGRAFTRWTGLAAPLPAMQAAARAALGR